MSNVLLESRPFRPFKSGEEYLVAMREDLAEWLQTLYPHLNIFVENFMEKLETGVALCEHANAVKQQATDYVERRRRAKKFTTPPQWDNLRRMPDVKYFSTAKVGTFFARDNVSNFIGWCRTALAIIDCLLFETDDLIMRKNEKHVILCLLEVARCGARFGMLAPMLIQMERQIDRELLGAEYFDDSEEGDGDMMEHRAPPVLIYGPVAQIVTNDLKSLDDMVRDLVEKCSCPTQFPMIRVSEGKYRIGDTKVLIFVRILRSHVMVRVGGGWDTLAHYLEKHDPCRCRTQHRQTSGTPRLVMHRPCASDIHGTQVYYDRLPSAGRSPQQRKSVKIVEKYTEPIDTSSLTDHSDDTTSEMSDEGYRSLGLIGQETNNNKKHEQLNDVGLRKTQFSQRIYSDDEKLPFVRNCQARRSISSITDYCQRKRQNPVRGRSFCSATTSPTKQHMVGGLKRELLDAVKTPADDATIVRQVQELLQKYGSLNHLNNCTTTASNDDDDEDDFLLVRNQPFRHSKRKDSHPTSTKIPAPIVHRMVYLN